MRIGVFHTTLPQDGVKPGGVAVYVHRLAEALVDAGHAVTVASLSGPPPGAGYAHLQLGHRGLAGSRAARMSVIPLLLHRLNRLDVDVLHLHGDDHLYLHRRHPTVRTFHGSAALEAIHAARARTRAVYAATYPLEVASARRATGVYAVGIDSASIYHARGILPIGVARPEPEPRSTAPAILFVGTWGGRKRGRILHRAFTEVVRPAHPDAELWMVSDRCEPAPGVRWFRAPTDAELSSMFSRAWVFCLPSSYEGFGIPYIEALAHGTPVVASANPGSHMTLRSGADGLIVDDDALGATLARLLRDPAERERWSVIAARAAERYTWAEAIRLHEDAYRRAIDAWDADAARPPA